MTTAAPPPAARGSIFLGVDVGTGSARAGRFCSPFLWADKYRADYVFDCVISLFDDNGRLLGSASCPIQIWKDGDCIEQSSTDIWLAICTSVKAACSLANVSGDEVTSLGFSATCSLVAIDDEGEPVTVSWSGDQEEML
ncbi:FGGY carbohydrate kinase domain-containing protein [Sesamum angolense]|uniref:FGGY carbohydrate kinase domain-containing protein n=1 Tax=Sesamum angolense TaxID=2727404 RepID=A0AAE1X4C8_9LAMI|nr:FGGY carbohydrate kinase domain-containing protein [Sesamum angolense]